MSDACLRQIALDDPAWSELAGSCAAATPFDHPAWARLLAETYGLHGFALVLAASGERPAAGAPFLAIRGFSGRRRWVGLPFTDACAPLATDDRAGRAFVEALRGAHGGLGAPAIELRARIDALGWRTNAGAVSHVLELEPDADAVRRRFSRSQVVRNIRRAERERVAVRVATGAGDLDAFYRLHTRTRRRQGVPVQPRRFFALLWKRLVEPGLATILLAHAGGAPVAGALFLHWNGTTVYKFGASDPESWPLRPNHLLFWTAIQDCCARGDRRLDFGRTDLGNAGLRAFKSAWGADERPLVYSRLAPRAAEAPDSAAGRALAVAIRRGPAWVCRGVGESLYRYAGAR